MRRALSCSVHVPACCSWWCGLHLSCEQAYCCLQRSLLFNGTRPAASGPSGGLLTSHLGCCL
jgi:hypothetical protein